MVWGMVRGMVRGMFATVWVRGWILSLRGWISSVFSVFLSKTKLIQWFGRLLALKTTQIVIYPTPRNTPKFQASQRRPQGYHSEGVCDTFGPRGLQGHFGDLNLLDSFGLRSWRGRALPPPPRPPNTPKFQASQRRPQGHHSEGVCGTFWPRSLQGHFGNLNPLGSFGLRCWRGGAIPTPPAPPHPFQRARRGIQRARCQHKDPTPKPKAPTQGPNA